MFRRIAVATLALAVGAAVSAVLVVYSNSAGTTRSFLAVTRDLPSGATISADSVQSVPAALDQVQAATLFSAADRGRVLGDRARHQLSAGQLLQRGDLEPAGGEAAESLVAVPLKELPPVHAGDRIDLFELVGSGDHLVAQPFAWAVSVAAVSAEGLVLQVPARQELGFVYAAASMRLAAVLTTAPAPPPGTVPITSPEQALAAAAG